MKRVVNIKDAVNRYMVEAGGYLLLVLVAVMVVCVVMRYIFHRPQVFEGELTLFLSSAVWLLPLGYLMRTGEHIVIDILPISTRKKAVIRVALSPLILLFLGLLFYHSLFFAGSSLGRLERSATEWNPPLYPIKLVLTISLFLLFVEYAAELAHNVKHIQGKTDTGEGLA